uniref:Uncharacterized protein n=1 Tax=Oryza brachyantha TaxID=4533 RepID=J3MM82_ORYBR
PGPPATLPDPVHLRSETCLLDLRQITSFPSTPHLAGLPPKPHHQHPPQIQANSSQIETHHLKMRRKAGSLSPPSTKSTPLSRATPTTPASLLSSSSSRPPPPSSFPAALPSSPLLSLPPPVWFA